MNPAVFTALLARDRAVLQCAPLVHLVYSVCLVCLVERNEPDRPEKPDEPERPDLSQTCGPSTLWRAHIVFPQLAVGESS